MAALVAWRHGLVRIEKTDLGPGRCRAGGWTICDGLAEFVSSYEFFRNRRNHTKQERVRALCRAHARRFARAFGLKLPRKTPEKRSPTWPWKPAAAHLKGA